MFISLSMLLILRSWSKLAFCKSSTSSPSTVAPVWRTETSSSSSATLDSRSVVSFSWLLWNRYSEKGLASETQLQVLDFLKFGKDFSVLPCGEENKHVVVWWTNKENLAFSCFIVVDTDLKKFSCIYLQVCSCADKYKVILWHFWFCFCYLWWGFSIGKWF